MWVKWQMRYEFIFIPVMAGVGGFYFFIRGKNETKLYNN